MQDNFHNLPLFKTVQSSPLQRPIVWSIAGSDSGGGAGIAADQRALESFDLHACAVIAAITAQNSVAVEKVEPVSAAVLQAQLAALAQDMPPAAIKTGMLASAENVHIVANWVDRLRKDNPDQKLALVVDPILRASTGLQFSDDALRLAMVRALLPRTTVLKPNLKEAFWLVTGEEKHAAEIDPLQMPALAKALRAMGAECVVITGGDYSDETGQAYVCDWLDASQTKGWLSLPRVPKTTTHGTGCTFTSSVAASLALGFCEADAVILAKMATTSAIEQGYAVGAGRGMVHATKGFALKPHLLPFLSDKPFDIKTANEFSALSNENMGLYAIVDSSEWVKRVINAGVKTVQLRMKSDDSRLQGPSGKQFLSDEIKRSCDYAQAAGVQFFVNDHWQLALKHGAYGVHLGQEDLPHADLAALRHAGMRLGVSTYSLWDVCKAKTVLPSYYACGPIYETQSKALSYLTQGLDNLAYFTHILNKPWVAIGGIDLAKTADVVRAGAKGVAVISAITKENEPEKAIVALQAEILKGQSLDSFAPPLLPHSVL